MGNLRDDNKRKTISTEKLAREVSHHKSSDKRKFYQQLEQLNISYTFITNEFRSEQKIIGFALFYDVIDFLNWINQPIEDIFGNVKKTLELFKCWEEDNYHLVLTIYSGLDEIDEIDKMSALEKSLFGKLKMYKNIDNALKHVVISQD